MSPVSEGVISAFLRKVKTSGQSCFFTFSGKPYTFAEVDRLSLAFAARMRQAGLAKGDRVAIMLHNSPEQIISIFGAARAGLVWVPINPQLRSASLRHVLDHSQPSALLACDESLEKVSDSGADLSHALVISVDNNWDIPELASNNPVTVDDAPPAVNDLFSIMYTSGTTGKPKGVLVTHKMITYATRAAMQFSDARDGEVLFMWEPIYHIAGAQVIFMPLLGNLQLAMVPRFSASRFWQQVRDAGATHIHYLGGILQILMRRPATEQDTRHDVRIAWGAGCSPDIWEAFQKRFNIEIRESYGMTETSSIASFNAVGKVGSVGAAVPWFDIRIIDEQGNPALPGQRGEIIVEPKEPGSVFAGYYKNEQATRETLRNGRVHTKDLGSIDDDGDLYFHGRMTDSMRCRGENVSAWEIEGVVANHPSVEACAVIGVEADIGEQEIKLFVQPKSNADVSPQALSQWLEQHLTSYQNPRFIEIVSGFEQTPSQRIMKHLLSRDTTHCWDRQRHLPAAARTAS